MEKPDWMHLIKYASVQLRKLDENGTPCGIGSGCLVDLKGKRFLFTVFHVTEKSSNWCAQIKFDEERQEIEVLFLSQFNYLGDFNLEKTVMVPVEFAYHQVTENFKCYFHNRTRIGKTVELTERPVLRAEDIDSPNPIATYGFSGDIRPEIHLGENALVTSHHIFYGLKFDRTENDVHYFKMPEKHPGHDFFKGCSGAPIIGDDGKIVSLVSGGCIESDEIYGSNLAKCIRTLDYFGVTNP
ncbi:MAG: hypothetical protein MRY76_11785 [Pseudomonadales bacterium]|nr:hypothetical protein [Pseudomonadales bacterium]